MVIWNATCWPPVAASPESWLNALPRLLPVRPNTLTKPGGSAPPLLKKLLSAVATLRWLTLRPPVPISLLAQLGVRFKIASVAV